jgi:AraC-like DNA-binding protein
MENISELSFSGYNFILYYAEMMDERIAEFPHHHMPYEIYYVLDGSIKINIAGRVRKIDKEQACFLSRDIKHHVFYEPDIKKKYFALIFDLALHETNSLKGPDGSMEYQDINDAMDIVNVNRHFISKPFSEQALLKMLDCEICKRELGWNTQAVMLCYQFFIHAMRQIATKSVADSQFSGKQNLAMSVSKYIHKHYQEEISVESAAKELNVTPRHINRAYKSMFSTTFMKNANLLRTAYSKDFLCTTDNSIEEIAEKIGFSSSRILYKLFKQYEGGCISQYRKHHNSSLQ